MKKYYKKPYEQNREAGRDDEKPIERSEGEFEKFIPYYDDEKGEYKYIPQSEITKRAEPEETEEAEEENAPGGLLERIEYLNGELKKCTRKNDTEKIGVLNEELFSLKEQLSAIKTQNEIKSEIEKFKKEFYENLNRDSVQRPYYGNPQYGGDNYGYRGGYGREYGDFNGYGYREKYVPPRQADYSPAPGADLEKLVDRVKKEIYQEKDLDTGKIIAEIEKLNQSKVTKQDIIDRVNYAVDGKLSEVTDRLIEGLSLKFEQRFNELKAANNAAINEALSKYALLQNENANTLAVLDDKISELKENLVVKSEESVNRQNDFLLKFSQIAEKIESDSIIDPNNLYYENLSDRVTEIKDKLLEYAKSNEEIKGNTAILGESLNEAKNEISLIKESCQSAFSKDLEERFEALTASAAKTEEKINECFNTVSEDIRITNETVNGLCAKTDFEALKENVNEIKAVLSGESASLMNKIGEGGENIIALIRQNFEGDAALKDELAAALSGISEKQDSQSAQISAYGESLNAAKEEISGQIAKIAENQTANGEKVSAVSESILHINENVDGKYAEICALIRENFEKVLQNDENLLLLKGEISENIAALSENISLNINKMKQEISAGFEKAKEEMLAEVRDALKEIRELPLNEMIEKTANIDLRISELSQTVANNTSNIDGLGISVDTLLRQAEENADTQSALSSNIEAINAELSGFSSKFEIITRNADLNKLNEDFAKVTESIKKISEKAEETASSAITAQVSEISQRLNEGLEKQTAQFVDYSKKIDENLAKNKDEFIEFSVKNSKIIKKLADDIAGLKNLVISTQNPDLSYDLSSIYSELKRIRNNSEAGSQAKVYEDNYLSLNSELESLRKELKEISALAETDKDKQKGQ